MGHFFTLVLLFTIYSFLGWLSESTYCSLLERRFINRKFLSGPVCPVYGFGALLVITVLTEIIRAVSSPKSLKNKQHGGKG